MKITIHRGIDQIGGCITDIATKKARILIDLGQNLPDGEGVIHDDLANRESIENLTRGVDAVFYTHYHGDHLGLFNLVPDNINQYIGKVAKRVALILGVRTSTAMIFWTVSPLPVFTFSSINRRDSAFTVVDEPSCAPPNVNII